jgi:hypothetical protein
MMQGRIDVVRPDGLIEGWCWNDESPESRLTVTVLIDGIEAGSALAAIYREDLRLAKIGDGCHAFSFVTQILPSSDKRTQNYTLIESESRRPFGLPLVVHNKEAISLDNRLLELETRNRLLAARLDELVRHDARTSSSALFSVVGEFFARLAKDMQRGEPLGIDRRLGEIAQAAAKTLGLLVFPIPEQPTMTILVQACSSLTHTHACLASLLRAGAGAMANIVVIDNGQAQDAVLLPSLVRGIRYVHTVAALTSEWDTAESTDHADCILMLSGAAIVGENSLREIAAAFAANRNAAAVGAHAARPGMQSTAGGLLLKDGTLEDCTTTGHPETRADLTAVYPAHAVSYQAAAFRRTAWRAVGGLDRAFEDDLGAAVIDLCFRLRQAGWSVLADPLATVELQPSFGEESWIPRGVTGGNSLSTELLHTRWFDVLVSHPPLYGSHATVVGIPGQFKDELIAVRRLREWGHSVDYLSAVALPHEEANDLRRAGVVLTLANDIGMALTSGGATLVYAAVESSTLDFIPPGSQLLVGLAALEHLRTASNPLGATVAAANSVDDRRIRQVAGL